MQGAAEEVGDMSCSTLHQRRRRTCCTDVSPLVLFRLIDVT